MPHVTSKDATRLAYGKQGAGPPLVVVMGALGYRDFSFSKQMEAELAKRFTVYGYDRRGRGESSDTLPYAVAREVEDLAAVVAAAGGRPYVVGLSSGAALALEAAASGVPMAGLAAYEPPYMVGDPKDRPDADFREKLEAFVARGERSEAVAYFMRTVGVPGFAVAIMKLFPFWKGMKSVAHTLPYDAAVMDGFVLPESRLASIRVPTLALAGGKTTPTLKAAVAAVARTVPGAKHIEIPKQNHGVKPHALAPVLAEHFR